MNATRDEEHRRLRPLDRALLGLEPHPDDHEDLSLVVAPHLCRTDGRSYGGAALAAALAASEFATGRTALWSTTQMIATADLGERIRHDAVRGGAPLGERTSRRAAHRSVRRAARPHGVVGPTHAGEPNRVLDHDTSCVGVSCRHDPDRGLSRVRRRGSGHESRQFLAYRHAWRSGLGVARTGRPRGGRRVRPRPGHLWSPEGALLATGSQSARLFTMDDFARRRSR